MVLSALPLTGLSHNFHTHRTPTKAQPSVDAQLLALSEKGKTTKIPLLIPKGVRITAAAALADIIERALVGCDQSWELLNSFATAAMSSSSSSNHQSRQSLTAALKTYVEQFADRLTSLVDDRAFSRWIPTDRILALLSSYAFILTAAVRIITSDDSVITPT